MSIYNNQDDVFSDDLEVIEHIELTSTINDFEFDADIGAFYSVSLDNID